MPPSARPAADSSRSRSATAGSPWSVACGTAIRSAREAGRTAPDTDLDLAVELVYGPLHYRRQYRLGPLTHDHADHLVDAAVRALDPSATSGGSNA
ncbi:TetR-like C-terminal domain-containing protein [Kitasatospora sp. NPDC093550]|uniref:TetR-like C-terminal domain-containing protein n=1 Tax=Kitasatospora sp. NPDC093550 TaxID=3364089 RepID=UPI00381AC3EE